MGVQFDRVLDGFAGPFEVVNAWNLTPPRGSVTGSTAGAFLTDRRVLNSAIAANRLMAAGEAVSVLRSPFTSGANTWPAGTFYVSARGSARTAVTRAADSLGVSFVGVDRGQSPDLARLRPARVGLWDTYGGSMPSGWTRWILEQFEFPYERVFAPALDRGNLNARYDVLVFVSGSIPGTAVGRRGGGGGPDSDPPDLPAEYRDQFGRVTTEKTLPQIREFIQNGGTVIAIGSSATNLAAFLQLPIENHLVENGTALPRTKFYAPGSVLRTRVDVSSPAAYGMSEHTDVFFDDSPVFKLGPNAAAAGVRIIAWYEGKQPLRSGWAWGQHYLENGVAAAEARVGKGRVLLFAPEILQRAQPHGTFKFLFNGIYQSVMGSGDAP